MYRYGRNETNERLKGRMHKIFEIFSLLWISIIFKIKTLFEFIRVMLYYYPNKAFAKIDLSLLHAYLFSSPFLISKHFLMEKGEKDVYAYGETPLTSLDKIAKTCDIKKLDVVYELGCGRGRTCFWLNSFIGCKVIGVEYIPAFIQKAEDIKKRWNVAGVSFKQEDFLNTDLSDATVIYLFGTCLDEGSIRHLAERIMNLSQEIKIITVSYALNEFLDFPAFRLIKQFPASFPWGTTDVYLQTYNF